jgi:hypothetical protein
LFALAVVFSDRSARAEVTPAAADEEAAYTQAINERAARVVATLGIEDAAKSERVQELIARQYRSLRQIHDTRDARINESKRGPAGDQGLAEAWVKATNDQAALKIADLHHYFVARLSVELTPEQVEKVKDGMTYGVVQVTYQRYLELLPELSEEHKREILANLLEAREHAMDGGSSEEKHAIFGKYKGRINNYLSAAGYDLKKAEQELAARQRSAARPGTQ